MFRTEKMTLPWQKRALDAIYPAIEEFATRRKASIVQARDGVSVRVPTGHGMMTVQVTVYGSGDDAKLEIVGVLRGQENDRTILSVRNMENSQVASALEYALR